MRVELGKISNVYFGYNEYCFGLHLELSGQGWGTCTSYDYNPNYKGDVIPYELKMIDNIQKLLKDAKVDKVEQLKGKPIEVTFESNLLKGFRILTEVL